MYYTLGVFLKEGENIEKVLAPFEFLIREEGAKEFMKFSDEEDDYFCRYHNEKEKMVIMPNGDFVSPNDKKFKVVMPSQKPFSKYKYDYSKLKKGESIEKVIPKELKIEEMAYDKIYKTFEEFMEKKYGYERDKEKGRYGYWYNPNAEYDWYSLGGRWSNILLIKQNAVSYLENLHLREPKVRLAPKGYKWVDAAKVKDIEWN